MSDMPPRRGAANSSTAGAKRKRENEAVIRCRQKKRQEDKKTQENIQRFQKENIQLTERVNCLQNQVETLKQLLLGVDDSEEMRQQIQNVMDAAGLDD